MKLSQTYEHLWNMHMFQVDEEVVDALKGSGFENMLAIAKLPKLNTCMPLIKYMVENYDTVDHCFVFPNDVRLYLSLKDIFFIWGLPITGQPIIGTECHGREISRDYFPNLDVIVKNRGFKLSTLKEIATDRANTLEIRVRATVMYVLGNLVVPDGTRNSVKAWYLYFLKDIEKIKNFAWGELLLVQIHFSILICKEKCSSGVGGSMYTLMIFALIHLKNLQRLFGFPEDFGLRRWPLIEDWSTQVQKTLKNAYAIPNDVHIQNVMTRFNNDDVIWSPYPIFDQVPACYKRNFRMFLAVILMFINNLCVFHVPHMSPQQFDIPKDTVEQMTCVLPRVKRIELKGNQGTGKKNYWSKWEVKLKCKVKEIRIKALNQDWLQFAEEEVNERQVEPEHEVHEPEPEPEVDEMNDEYRKKRFRENPIVYERRKKMKLPSHQSPVTLSTDDGGQVGQKVVYEGQVGQAEKVDEHPDVATCCLMSDDGGQSGHQEIQDKVDE